MCDDHTAAQAATIARLEQCLVDANAENEQLAMLLDAANVKLRRVRKHLAHTAQELARVTAALDEGEHWNGESRPS